MKSSRRDSDARRKSLDTEWNAAAGVVPYDPAEDTHAGTIGISGLNTPAEKLSDLARQIHAAGRWLKGLVKNIP